MIMEVIDRLMPEKASSLPVRDDEIENIDQLFLGQRIMNLANNPDMKNTVVNKNQNIPPELRRN